VTFSDALLPELDQEAALTRRLLERVPEDAFDWRPHERSMSLGRLATHLAELVRWGNNILERDGYDLVDHTRPRGSVESSRQAVLDLFDRQVAEVRRNLAGRTDAELAAPWVLRRGAQTVMSMPRVAALRRFLLNHLVHHRGQLSVYLRLQNVSVPPIYGPSADEGM
jgi:uncharacterized damage-inducible protein DinB